MGMRQRLGLALGTNFQNLKLTPSNTPPPPRTHDTFLALGINFQNLKLTPSDTLPPPRTQDTFLNRPPIGNQVFQYEPIRTILMQTTTNIFRFYQENPMSQESQGRTSLPAGQHTHRAPGSSWYEPSLPDGG